VEQDNICSNCGHTEEPHHVCPEIHKDFVFHGVAKDGSLVFEYISAAQYELLGLFRAGAVN